MKKIPILQKLCLKGRKVDAKRQINILKINKKVYTYHDRNENIPVFSPRPNSILFSPNQSFEL